MSIWRSVPLLAGSISVEDSPTNRNTDSLRRVAKWLASPVPVLALMIGAVTLFAAHYLKAVDTWRVMTDELLYVKLAVNMIESGSLAPAVRGDATPVYNILYPLMIAPILGLFEMPTAFKIIIHFNAFLIASAAIPAYLMARDLVPWRWGRYLVAAMTIVIPWLAQSTSVMTESAAYPAYAWAIFAMYKAIEQPSWRRDLLAIAALVAAYLTRTQFALLSVIFPAALVAHEVGFALAGQPLRDAGRNILQALKSAIRSHKTLLAAGALLAIWLIVRSPTQLLGSYGGTADGDLIVDGFWRNYRQHIDFIIVGIGVIPALFAFAWFGSNLLRPASRQAHAFSVVATFAVLTTTFVSTSFDLRYTMGQVTQERYLFYIVPLFFVGMGAYFAERRRMLVPTIVATVALCALLWGEVYEPGLGYAVFSSPNRLFFQVIGGRSIEFGQIFGIEHLKAVYVIVAVVITTAALTLAALRRGWQRHAFITFGALVLLFGVLQTRYVFPTVAAEHVWPGSQHKIQDRDWVDTAVPKGTVVAMVPSIINSRDGVAIYDEFLTEAFWWDVEFWNRSVNRLYMHQGYAPTLGPAWPLEINRTTGTIKLHEGARGAPADRLLLVTSDVRFAPTSVSRPIETGDFTIYDTPHPYSASWVSNIGGDGWTDPSEQTSIRFFGKPGPHATSRHVKVILYGGNDIGRPRQVTIRGKDVRDKLTVSHAATTHFNVCVKPGETQDIDIDVDGKTNLGTAKAPRMVGIRIVLIQARDTGKRCSP